MPKIVPAFGSVLRGKEASGNVYITFLTLYLLCVLDAPRESLDCPYPADCIKPATYESNFSKKLTDADALPGFKMRGNYYKR